MPPISITAPISASGRGANANPECFTPK